MLAGINQILMKAYRSIAAELWARLFSERTASLEEIIHNDSTLRALANYLWRFSQS